MENSEEKTKFNSLPEGTAGDCIRRIHSLVAALHAGLSARLASSHLSLAQMKLLARISRAGEHGCRVSDIAKMQLSGTKQNVSSMLKKLHKAGYLTSCSDERDKRSHTYLLTRDGQEKIAEFLPIHNEYMRTVFSAFDDAELTQLLGLLTRLEISAINEG